MDTALSDASTISEDRMRAALQSSGSPSPTGGAPRGRHRFVQDGEVPVVVVNQRYRGPEESRAAVADLERLLGIERDARSTADKALMQAEETIRQLRTRLAHAEIARDEVAAAPPPMQPAPPAPVEEEEEVVAAAPKRGRPRKVPSAQENVAVADETASTDDREDESGGEAIEWWRPGWRERLRSGQ